MRVKIDGESMRVVGVSSSPLTGFDKELVDEMHHSNSVYMTYFHQHLSFLTYEQLLEFLTLGRLKEELDRLENEVDESRFDDWLCDRVSVLTALKDYGPETGVLDAVDPNKQVSDRCWDEPPTTPRQPQCR